MPTVVGRGELDRSPGWQLLQLLRLLTSCQPMWGTGQLHSSSIRKCAVSSEIESLALFDIPDGGGCANSSCSALWSRRDANGVHWCYAHYMQEWRYGAGHRVRPRQNNSECTVCGSTIPTTYGHNGRKMTGRRYCSKVCSMLETKARNYGVSGAFVLAMWEAQDRRCAICGRELTRLSAMSSEVAQRATVPRIDHDHETGEVRGLLCDGCNKGIGTLGEDPDILRRAADYLERYRE